MGEAHLLDYALSVWCVSAYEDLLFQHAVEYGG